MNNKTEDGSIKNNNDNDNNNDNLSQGRLDNTDRLFHGYLTCV